MFVSWVGERDGIRTQFEGTPSNLKVRMLLFQFPNGRLAEPAEGSNVIGKYL
jgi:hypothetical protein